MNTRLDVVMHGISQQEGERIFFEISKIVDKIEQSISRFIPHSKITAINNAKKHEPVTIPDDLVEIFSVCSKYFDTTNGYFDIAIAPLIDLWKAKHKTYPDADTVEEVKQKTGSDKLQIDKTKNSIQKKVDSILLDFGGFGKGFAVEKIKEYLQSTSIKNALICFGNSAIYGLGQHPFGEYWSLGIHNVTDKKQSIHEIQLKNKALSTSGVTGYDSKNQQLQIQSLLINPKTGYQVPCTKTLSVVAHSSLEAEILSTTLLLCGDDDKKQIMNGIHGIQIIEIDYSDLKNIKKKQINMN